MHMTAIIVGLLLHVLAGSAWGQVGPISVRVRGVDSSQMQHVSQILIERVDGLRTELTGATHAEIEGDVVHVSFRGWAPDLRHARFALAARRSFRAVVESDGHELFNESDIEYVLPWSTGRPELAIQLNEGGVRKVRERSKELVGKILVTYWDQHVVSRATVTGELVEYIATSVPSIEIAATLSAVLRARAFPPGVSVGIVK
jgi:hypothetical protein